MAGLGLGHVELCAIAEELGRVVAPIPFASIYVFAEALLSAGAETHKQDLLPGVVTGHVIGCLATSEGPGAVSADSLQSVVRDGRLSGSKLPVTDGDIATHAIVSAVGENGPGLYLVDLTANGVTRETLKDP